MVLKFYRFLVFALTPFLLALSALRALRGYEEWPRLRERRGLATKARPLGPVLWVHAASVGETRSVLPLIYSLLQKNPDLTCLVTTVTLTAARTIAGQNNPRIVHQFAPFDHPTWVARFLNTWAPDAVVWVESELWPTMLEAVKTRGLPLTMVNGRLSARSAARWQKIPNVIGQVMAHFDLCLAQSGDDAARLRAIGARNVVLSGNMKYASAPLPYNTADLEALHKSIGARPLLLFASTHAGEEDIALTAHAYVQQALPDILSIILPRHPKRGDEIAALCDKRQLPYAQRSKAEAITSTTSIYVADTLGEPGLFYRLCPVVYVGNSLNTKPGGGHNPIEPAQLGCAIVYGPSMFNFAEIDAGLRACGGAVMVDNALALSNTLHALLNDGDKRQALSQAARAYVATQNDVLENTLAQLRPYLTSAKIAA